MSRALRREQLRAALRLVAVTPDGADSAAAAVSLVRPALRGGVTMLQYRDKRVLATALREEIARALRAVCAEAGVLFVVNDSVDLALRVGADGAHLGPDDEPVAAARLRVSERFVLGASAGSVEAAQAAFASGADYLGVGAIFDARATKANASEPRGVAHLRAVRAALPRMPLVGIGGISEQNASSVTRAGADGIAVVRAAFGGEDRASRAAGLLASSCEGLWLRRAGDFG